MVLEKNFIVLNIFAWYEGEARFGRRRHTTYAYLQFVVVVNTISSDIDGTLSDN